MPVFSSSWFTIERPRFQVVNTRKRHPPKASGNQPPCGIFAAFDTRNTQSTAISGRNTSSTRHSGQSQRSRATSSTPSVVIAIEVATAMPYAAARLVDEPKPTTSATTRISSAQFTNGT